MLVVGLTGSIATGKSTVAALMSEEGNVPCIDCDLLARDIVKPGTRCYKLIVARFGGKVCVGGIAGEPLDREALAKIVFSDRDARHWLNSVTHWRIGLLIARALLWHWLSGEGMVILDAPLLFESGLERICSRVVCVSVSPQMQIGRLMARDGVDASFARAKIDAQMSNAAKCKRAHFVIDNNGALEETRTKVRAAMNQLRALPPPFLSRRNVAMLSVTLAGMFYWWLVAGH